jgi:tRNA-specific 2-thiouridylase
METAQPGAWVACAMSGGVDSSVAAALLQRQGFHVIGVTMRLWDDGIEHTRACCSLTAVDDAKRVAVRLGIPHYVLDFSAEFGRTVIDDFVAEYRAGRTPNPCIRCNRFVKFETLLAHARGLGATCLATGHYARVAQAGDRWCVRRGVDAGKDQSYALYGLTQAQLARTLLPIGALEKTHTRALAAELGLRVAGKPDSQEICFIPDNDYGRFLRDAAPAVTQPGPMVDRAGTRLGTHDGVAFYTIGQRRRLPVAIPEARYVTAIDAAANTITIGPREETLATVVTAVDVVPGKWDAGTLHTPRRVTAMVRYRMPPQPAVAHLDGDTLHVVFDTPQFAVTPGQAVVCYDGDDVVCGGTIV